MEVRRAWTYHGERVWLEDGDLVFPLFRDENRHRELVALEQEGHTTRRLERALVEQHTELACKRFRAWISFSCLMVGVKCVPGAVEKSVD